MANVPQIQAEPNDPSRRGQYASKVVTFGENRRYAVFAVHTRFDAVQWFVNDAEVTNPSDGRPETIRQEATLAEAVAGLVDGRDLVTA